MVILPGRKEIITLPLPVKPDDFALAMRQQAVEALTRIKTITGQLQFGDQARAYYCEWYKTFVGGKDRFDAWVSRMTAYALKIGMIYAASCGRSEVELRDLVLATNLLNKLRQDLILLCDDTLGFSKFERTMKKVRQNIKDSGAKGVDHATALRNSHVGADEFKKIILTLYERNELVVIGDGTKGNKTSYQWVG